MTREGALAVMVTVAVLLLTAMYLGWRRRRNRDAHLSAPLGETPETAEVFATGQGFYVATTSHGAPLDRLAIKPLAYRSRVTVTVSAAGVGLDLPGAPRVLIPLAQLQAFGRATWAIDRVVEPGGLPFITWAVTEEVTADTYFRVQDGDLAGVLDALGRLLPRAESTSTGTPS